MKIRAWLSAHGIDGERQLGLGTMKGHFLDINWVKTLWFNFKALPLKYAWRLPILISWNVKVRHVGKIRIEEPVTPGMISIGVLKIDPWESNADQIIFSNEGELTFGGRIKIHPGVRLAILPGARMTLGERTLIGCRSRVICAKSITTGHDVRISWDCQVLDTDFHFFHRLEPEKYYPRLGPVTIGNNVFVGNRTTLCKGTHLPDGSVVSCCSKVSGDLRPEGENLLIKGDPAEVVARGYNMGNSWYPEREAEIAQNLGLDKI